MDKDILDIIKFSIGTCVAVIGWIVAYYFTIKRDREAKRREISLEHLISAYRILVNDISHREEDEEKNTKLESIIADIQLFGNQEQIDLSKELADNISKGGYFDLDPLINSLRNDLRKQLQLPKINGNVRWLRFNKKNH